MCELIGGSLSPDCKNTVAGQPNKDGNQHFFQGHSRLKFKIIHESRSFSLDRNFSMRPIFAVAAEMGTGLIEAG